MYVAEVFREALKRGGYYVKIDFLPWARVVALAKDGKYHSYGPEYYDKVVEEKIYFSNSFSGGPLGFIKMKNKNINFSKIEDFKTYRIGVVRGYIHTKEFDDASYRKKDEAVDNVSNIKKLVNGRIDLFVCDKFVGSYLIKKEMPGNANDIEYMNPVLENKELYLCINKNVPNAKAKIDAFNNGLKSMKNDGTSRKIMVGQSF